MRNARARTWWWVVGALALGMTAAGTARADTVYFKNGTSMWGDEAEVEGGQVILTKGGQTLKFPLADVDRVEKKRTNMPEYKVDAPPPPAGGPPPRGGPGPGGPGGPPPAPPPAFSPSGPGGPQGAIPAPGGGAPEGAIPIPGAGPGGPPPAPPR